MILVQAVFPYLGVQAGFCFHFALLQQSKTKVLNFRLKKAERSFRNAQKNVKREGLFLFCHSFEK